MDRRFDPDQAAMDRDRVGLRGSPSGPLLPTRQEARSACLRALSEGKGPALLIGEAGSGKTWLWRTMIEAAPSLGRWIALDLAPTDEGIDLVRRLLRSLGRVDSSTVADPRSELADEFAEQSEEGRRWVLVIDEAQNASDLALEEIRLLANRLGRPDGVAGLLLVGRTGLAIRLRKRPWESLESRLSAIVPLGPIDAEEARILLDQSGEGGLTSWPVDLVEALHVRAFGNPARLRALATRHARSLTPKATSPPPTPSRSTAADPRPRRPEPAPVPSGSTADLPVEPPLPIVPSTTFSPPRLGASRPPLRFEEGVIEVGWDDEQDGESPSSPEFQSEPSFRAPAPSSTSLDNDFDSGPNSEPSRSSTVVFPTTEEIVDPYAAIQARLQWSIAVEAVRRGTSGEIDPELALGVAESVEDGDDLAAILSESEGESAVKGSSLVRAESGQEFAPYGRLFSQINSANGPE